MTADHKTVNRVPAAECASSVKPKSNSPKTFVIKKMNNTIVIEVRKRELKPDS